MKKYLLTWVVHFVHSGIEKHYYNFREFNDIWSARSFADQFDDHCSHIKIYELVEEYIEENEDQGK